MKKATVFFRGVFLGGDNLNFTKYATDGIIPNPYGGKTSGGTWIPGEVAITWLEKNFKDYETFDECIQATESEGLRLFFEHLKAQQ